MPLLVFEFLGTTELLVIAFVALIIFGPRKLPDLGRTLGKHLGEFKRASEDFKRTWEREVETEKIERELRIDTEARAALDAMPDNAASTSATQYNDETANYYGVSGDYSEEAPAAAEPQTVARDPNVSEPLATAEAGEGSRKRDWL